MVKRKPPIRIRQSDIKEYQRLRRNYQNKTARVARQTGFSTDIIREELGIDTPSLNEFKSGKAFNTRDEYNKWKRQVSKVNKRGYKPLELETNKKGMKYPKMIKDIGERETSLAQQNVDEMIEDYKDMPFYVDDEERGTVSNRELMVPDSESFGLYKPDNFNIDNFTNPKSVEKNIYRNKERQTEDYYYERKKQMRDNFASIFESSDDLEKSALANTIRSIDPNDFYEIYLQFDNFDFDEWDSETGNIITNDPSRDLELVKYYFDKYDKLDKGQLDMSLKDIG